MERITEMNQNRRSEGRFSVPTAIWNGMDRSSWRAFRCSAALLSGTAVGTWNGTQK